MSKIALKWFQRAVDNVSGWATKQFFRHCLSGCIYYKLFLISKNSLGVHKCPTEISALFTTCQALLFRK